VGSQLRGAFTVLSTFLQLINSNSRDCKLAFVGDTAYGHSLPARLRCYVCKLRNGLRIRLVLPVHVQGSFEQCSPEVGAQRLRVDLAVTASGRNSCAAQQTCSFDHRGAIEFCKPRIVMLLHRGLTIVQ
jgi:hypothetical protein